MAINGAKLNEFMNCTGCGQECPPEARFCGACGAKLPEALRPIATADNGERRHATVMFSDLSGYTALGESIDPEDVEEIMERIKREAVAVIERHGGTVNQFVGDEIMALFGVPQANRDDSRHAVQAALELHCVVDAIAAGIQARIGRVLSMHSGIHSGLVVARRSDHRSGEFNLTGDAVNTAARLRAMASPGEILVSDETWRQIAEFFDATPGVPVVLKGKEQPVIACGIRRERAEPLTSMRPMVGRAEELQQFATLGRACAQGAIGQVVFVRGDPGMGKSRLAAEFLVVARGRGFSCHSASVLDFGPSTGRAMVRDLVKSLLGLPPNADETLRREAVAQRKMTDDQALFLYDLVDVAPPLELRALLTAMNGSAREMGALQTLCGLVRYCIGPPAGSSFSAAMPAGSASVAAMGVDPGPAPVMLLVEDIHWADGWALERLAALAALTPSHPLLLVMTTRFADDPSMGEWRTALHGAPIASMDLGPLPTDDAIALAKNVTSLPEAQLRGCVERAEGNPLFLEQLMLNAGQAGAAHLPGSVQALVHARMDRLAPSDKSALQAASVLGQRYALDALRHLVEDVTYDCKVLVAQFLVRREGDELQFCHALIRDGAYGSLLHSRQRRLHTRAAEWFQASDVEMAAEHFDRAGDSRAAGAYLIASNAAAAQFRYPGALAQAERGHALASEPDVRFALQMARVRSLLELGRAGEAIEACRVALAAAEKPAERAQALIEMAAGMRILDQLDDGLTALAQAEPFARAAAQPLELSRLHHLRGNLFFPLGRLEECLREHTLALECARQAGALEAQAVALGGLGDAHYLRGQMRQAHEQFRRCVAMSREHGYGRLEVSILHMVGWSGIHLNDTQGAYAVACEAANLAVRACHPRAEVLARLLTAYVCGWLQGNCEEARRQLDSALPLITSLQAKRFEAQHWQQRALLDLRCGDLSSARSHIDMALAICREHGMAFFGPAVFGVLARLAPNREGRMSALAEGEAQLARGCVSHNHFIFREHGIEACLDVGEWDAVEGLCRGLDQYTAADPLPWSLFVSARGRALVRCGRGERDEGLRVELTRLRDEALAAGLCVALPALDRALAAIA